MSLCPFLTTITITPRAAPLLFICYISILRSVVCDTGQWFSGRVSALHSMVANSIAGGRDDGIHC